MIRTPFLHSGQRRVSLLDQQWFGHWSARLVTPLQMPNAEELRRTLRNLMVDHPGQRIICRLAPQSRRWVQIPRDEIEAYLETIIVPVDDPVPGSEDDSLVEHFSGVDGQASMVVLVGHRTLALYNHHALGDGFTSVLLVRALLTGEFAAMVARDSRDGMTVVVRAAIRHAARGSLSRPHYPSPAAETIRTTSMGGATVSTRIPKFQGEPCNDPTMVSVPITNEDFRQLKEWRRTNATEVSLSSVLTSAIAISLLDHGVPIDPTGYYALIDVRRYLQPQYRSMWGNLAKSLHVPADLTNPRSVQASMTALLKSNWPIASTVYGACVAPARHMMRRPRSQLATLPVGRADAWPTERVSMAVSILQNLPALAVPWQENAISHRYFGGGFPVPPGSLTISAIRFRTHVDVVASVTHSSVAPAQVRAALQALADVPRLFGEPSPGGQQV